MPQKSWILRNEKKKRPVSKRNRCRVCGNPRGFMGKFGMCRKCFREHALRGNLPGVIKASW